MFKQFRPEGGYERDNSGGGKYSYLRYSGKKEFELVSAQRKFWSDGWWGGPDRAARFAKL